MSYEPSLMPNQEARLLEQIIDLFKKHFLTITKKAIFDFQTQKTIYFPGDFSLHDAIVNTQSSCGQILFIYGASSSGCTNSVSINKTDHAIEVVISLPFREISIIGRENLQNFWIEIWDSLKTFGISILATGDELEFNDCSMPEQTNLFLNTFSLACWVVVSAKLAVNSLVSFDVEAYNILSENFSYTMFVSKNIDQRLRL